MTQEEIDFTYFKFNQLANIDFKTGRIDVRSRTRSPNVFKITKDAGSLNQDGYVRIWCNGKLRMKHRLLFWMYHGYLPIEVDHDDKQRANNSITNLIASNRVVNTKSKTVRSYKQLTVETVNDLCKDIAKGNVNITELAKKYGRSRVQIKAILTKKYWSHVSDTYF